MVYRVPMNERWKKALDAAMDYVDMPLVKGAVRHVTGTCALVLLFRGAGFVIEQFVQDAKTRTNIDHIENFVMTGIIVVLGLLLFILVCKGVWKEGRSGWNDTHFLAI